nr:chemotaxis protein CheA [candidate division Zixibacteria bacterium]
MNELEKQIQEVAKNLQWPVSDLESRVEHIATDLVMVDTDDLPALANLHENFLELIKSINDDTAVTSRVAANCADLVEKIVLSEVDSKAAAIELLNSAVTGLQAIIRDRRQPSEVVFPESLAPADLEEELNEPEVSQETVSEPEKSPAVILEKNKPVSKEPAPQTEAEPLIINLDGSDTSLLAEFITEAMEHCATAEQMLMDMETDPGNKSAIDAIFRSFHTIKGAAGFLELKPILVLAHESETLLDLARKGTVAVKGKIADIIFDSIDTMRTLLKGLEELLKSGGTYDGGEVIGAILGRLKDLLANIDRIEDYLQEEDVSNERLGDILVKQGTVAESDIEEALANKSRPEEKVGETLVKQGRVPAKAVAQALREQQRARHGNIVKEMVKIDTERLDRLVDTIGELVIAESMVGQDEEILAKASTKISKNISHLNKITRELQEMGMAMRLVPVQSAFQKLARAVRDLARKSDKQVNLILSGEDSEVDRSIVENIGDPLMHMVRNSIDHGLETAKDRLKAGKPEEGHLWIRAFHKGGNIYFEVEDDGRGLDTEKIVNKARERGLLPPNKELSEKEIFSLIMLPGFSTASQITNISGRGVGMDVVRKNIDAMRGHLEIESEKGQGTKFSMKLPLTLAIIDGMLVSVGCEKFIIPTLSVVESLQLTPDMISTVNSRNEMINIRGKMLPLNRVRDLFDIPSCDNENSDSTVVIVDDMENRIGLVVDKLLGQRQTVIKSLGRMFEKQKWISGGAILSDGNIGLIIDINGIVELARTVPSRRVSRIDISRMDGNNPAGNETSAVSTAPEEGVGTEEPVVEVMI